MTKHKLVTIDIREATRRPLMKQFMRDKFWHEIGNQLICDVALSIYRKLHSRLLYD